MTFISTRRALAAIVAAASLAVPATASATPYSSPTTTTSDAAQSGTDADMPDRSQPYPFGGLWDLDHTPSESTATSTFPFADFSGGDSPVDHPGASRARPTPTTVEVVRPERTIVRDVDQALPLALAGSALVLALAMFAIMLVRTRLVPRPGSSR
jgi:hypothetical protein